MAELVIKNGIIVDGTGSAPYHADILVRGGKIAGISEDFGSVSCETVDAAGRYVTPGFIDIHRHADAAVFGDDFGKIELSQGITTIVNGQCGLSLTPAAGEHKKEIFRFLEPVIGELRENLPAESTGAYLDALEKRPLRLNVGYCVGNGTLRMNAKGFNGGDLTEAEMKSVHENMEEALSQGALGVSMGIVYSPENCYSFEGFVRALSPMKKYRVPLVAHIRGYGDLLLPSVQEIIRIAEELQVSLHISHLMAVGQRNWNQSIFEAFRLMNEARERGLSVSCDVYPYTAGSSQLIQILPPWYQEGGTDEIVRRLSDQKTREELKKILSEPQTRFENLIYASGWDALLITTVGSEKNRNLVGKTVARIAAEQGKTPEDAAFDLLIEEKCNVTMVNFITCEEDILRILQYPYSNLISDSVYPKSGLPHPRLYGAFPKLLTDYVRDRKLIPVEEAVRKMTGSPASVYRIGKKGLLKEGYDADINVFDLNNVASPAGYTDPFRFGEGMERVYVNGKAAYMAQDITGEKAGRLLRRDDRDV